jgi:hypothetical protein
VKLVLAAAMWNSPHLLIMDEPTNYLDRWAGAWGEIPAGRWRPRRRRGRRYGPEGAGALRRGVWGVTASREAAAGARLGARPPSSALSCRAQRSAAACSGPVTAGGTRGAIHRPRPTLGPRPTLPARPPRALPRRRRDSLGALATAIREFDGGVILVSHNSEFTSTCCHETWTVSGGRVGVVSAYEQRQRGAAAAEGG